MVNSNVKQLVWAEESNNVFIAETIHGYKYKVVAVLNNNNEPIYSDAIAEYSFGDEWYNISDDSKPVMNVEEAKALCQRDYYDGVMHDLIEPDSDNPENKFNFYWDNE